MRRAQRCASCHGVAGAGDGMLARSLTRLPPEVGTVAWQVEHSDEQLADVVRGGIPATAMPASGELTPAQVQSVVAYVRTLPTKDRNGLASSDSSASRNVSREIVALLEQSLSAAKRASRSGKCRYGALWETSALRAKNPGLVSSMGAP